MFSDLIAAYHAAVREWKRRRWVRSFAKNSNLPF